jgi:hypothetical protein
VLDTGGGSGTTGNAYSFDFDFGAKLVGATGTTAFGPAPIIANNRGDAGLSGVSAQLVYNSLTVDLQVVGLTGYNLNWFAEYDSAMVL